MPRGEKRPVTVHTIAEHVGVSPAAVSVHSMDLGILTSFEAPLFLVSVALRGIPDLLIGAEDGFFYQVTNPRARR